GPDDPICVKYLIQMERLAIGRGRYGVNIFGRATQDIDLLAEAIWVVVGLDSTGSTVVTGTAFSLADVGIMSACHVFDSSHEAIKWELIHASNHHERLQITAVREDRHTDAALLEWTGRIGRVASLVVAERRCGVNDVISVAGFPEWHTLADRLS